MIDGRPTRFIETTLSQTEGGKQLAHAIAESFLRQNGEPFDASTAAANNDITDEDLRSGIELMRERKGIQSNSFPEGRQALAQELAGLVNESTERHFIDTPIGEHATKTTLDTSEPGQIVQERYAASFGDDRVHLGRPYATIDNPRGTRSGGHRVLINGEVPAVKTRSR